MLKLSGNAGLWSGTARSGKLSSEEVVKAQLVATHMLVKWLSANSLP